MLMSLILHGTLTPKTKIKQVYMSDEILLNTFFWAAIVLMAIATSGVGYLTYLEWQDRRRRGGKS